MPYFDRSDPSLRVAPRGDGEHRLRASDLTADQFISALADRWADDADSAEQPSKPCVDGCGTLVRKRQRRCARCFYRNKNGMIQRSRRGAGDRVAV